jgi:hypothetical protein
MQSGSESSSDKLKGQFQSLSWNCLPPVKVEPQLHAEALQIYDQGKSSTVSWF